MQARQMGTGGRGQQSPADNDGAGCLQRWGRGGTRWCQWASVQRLSIVARRTRLQASPAGRPGGRRLDSAELHTRPWGVVERRSVVMGDGCCEGVERAVVPSAWPGAIRGVVESTCAGGWHAPVFTAGATRRSTRRRGKNAARRGRWCNRTRRRPRQCGRAMRRPFLRSGSDRTGMVYVRRARARPLFSFWLAAGDSIGRWALVAGR